MRGKMLSGQTNMSTFSGTREIMTSRRCNRLNLLSVAFMAIMGILSVGDTVSACTDSKALKACCKASLIPNCGCCAPSSSSVKLTPTNDRVERPAAVSFVGHQAAHQSSSCECRPDDTPAPASKPVAASPEESRVDSAEQLGGSFFAFVRTVLVPRYFLDSLNDGTTKCPVYLRTLHLLV